MSQREGGLLAPLQNCPDLQCTPSSSSFVPCSTYLLSTLPQHQHQNLVLPTFKQVHVPYDICTLFSCSPKTPRRPSKYRNTSDESESFVKRFLRRGISLKNWKVMKTTNGKYHVWKDENSLWRWLGIFGEHYHRYLKKKKIDGQYKRLKFNREIQHRDIEDTSRLTKPRRRGGVADGASGFRCEARLGDSSSGLVIPLFP